MEPAGTTFPVRRQQCAFKSCLFVKCFTRLLFPADAVLRLFPLFLLCHLSCINLSMLNQCFLKSEYSSTMRYLDFSALSLCRVDWCSWWQDSFKHATFHRKTSLLIPFTKKRRGLMWVLCLPISHPATEVISVKAVWWIMFMWSFSSTFKTDWSTDESLH